MSPAPPAPPQESGSVSVSTPYAPAIGGAAKESGGLLAGLFGKKREKNAVNFSPRADDVQFRAAAPDSVIPGRYFTVKMMMYLDGDHARADREQQSLGDKIKAASSSIFKAKKNQQFRIVLQSPDTPLEDCSETLVWNGKYASTDMEVLLPQDYDKPQLRLRGRVYSGNAALTDLKLILEVNAAKGQNVDCEKCELRSAFISYASQDREKVVARIQGIQLACPDMDLFFDVENLRRGEHWQPRLFSEISKRDLFYLFWSRNAAQSEWVAKELAFALANKNTDYIEPIPLESPEVCPPPAALNDRHFNDWTLRYLNK